jgi:hypothetical protein
MIDRSAAECHSDRWLLLYILLQEWTAIESDRSLPYWVKNDRMRTAMLNAKTLAEVRRERFNYTQLLYR